MQVDAEVEEERSKMKIQVDAEVEEERLKMKIPVDVEVEEECSKWTMRVDEEEEEELHSIRFLFVLALDAEPLVLACNDEVAPDHKAFLVLACNDEVAPDHKASLVVACNDEVVPDQCNDEVGQTDTNGYLFIMFGAGGIVHSRSRQVCVSTVYRRDEQWYQVSVDICSSYSDVDVSVDILGSSFEDGGGGGHRSFRVSVSVPLFYC